MTIGEYTMKLITLSIWAAAALIGVDVCSTGRQTKELAIIRQHIAEEPVFFVDLAHPHVTAIVEENIHLIAEGLTLGRAVMDTLDAADPDSEKRLVKLRLEAKRKVTDMFAAADRKANKRLRRISYEKN